MWLIAGSLEVQRAYSIVLPSGECATLHTVYVEFRHYKCRCRAPRGYIAMGGRHEQLLESVIRAQIRASGLIVNVYRYSMLFICEKKRRHR